MTVEMIQLIIAGLPIAGAILGATWVLSRILSKHDSQITDNTNHIVDIKGDLKELRNEHDVLDTRVTVIESRCVGPEPNCR